MKLVIGNIIGGVKGLEEIMVMKPMTNDNIIGQWHY